MKKILKFCICLFLFINCTGNIGKSQTSFEKVISTFISILTELTAEKLKANKKRPKMISAGEDYSLTLDEKGYLYSWGFNQRGQLGDGTTKDKYTATKIGNRKYKFINAGKIKSYAIDEEGYLWGWGGYVKTCNPSDDVLSPMQIGDRNYSFVYTDIFYTYAIDSEGYLWVWGCHTENKLTPRKTNNIKYKDVSAGYSHTLAIDEDDYLWVWGKNEYGQLGDGTTKDNKNVSVKINNQKYKSIAAISSGSAAINQDGYLYIWGNIWGEKFLYPTKVGNKKYKKIVTRSSGAHFLLLGEDDYAYALGKFSSFHSILGNGTRKENRIIKIPIKIGNKKYKSISTGKKYLLALDKDDNIYTWGNNKYGIINNGQSISVVIPRKIESGNKKFKKISTGSRHSLAIDEQDNLYSWGDDTGYRQGILGNGKTGNIITTPTKIGNGKYASISTKLNFSLAIDKEGYIWSWGSNYKGSLGIGNSNITESLTPIKIDNKKYKHISAGYYHSLAIDEDDYLWTWGRNKYGLLGIGNSNITESPTPIKIGDRKYKYISAGEDNSYAIDKNGSLYFWGQIQKRLNIDIDSSKIKKHEVYPEFTISYTDTPTQVGRKKYKSVSVTGQVYVLGLTEDDSLVPFYYEIDKDYNYISALNFLTKNIYRSISAGTSHVLVIDSNSNIYSWGNNRYGQLGLGYVTDTGFTKNPTKISNRKFKAVSASPAYNFDRQASSLAIDEKGDLYGWGYNYDNFMGTKLDALPVRIVLPSN